MVAFLYYSQTATIPQCSMKTTIAGPPCTPINAAPPTKCIPYVVGSAVAELESSPLSPWRIWRSYVRPAGAQTVPSALGMSTLQVPSAHRCQELVRQFHSPSESGQADPGAWHAGTHGVDEQSCRAEEAG